MINVGGAVLTIAVQHHPGGVTQHDKARKKQQKEMKSIWIRRKKSVSLLLAGMALHRENPEEPTKWLLQLISEFSKDAGYMVNI